MSVEIDIGVAGHGDRHALAVESRGIQRLQVVDGGDIVRGKIMRAARRGVVRAITADGPRVIIVQAFEPRHHVLERLGHRWQCRIGEMHLAVRHIAMKLGAKSPPDMCRGT